MGAFVLFCIYAFLVIINLIQKKSRISFASLGLYLWFLAAFCGDNADRVVYTTRYYNYDKLSDFTEPIFTLAMSICNDAGFSFEYFLMSFWLVYMIILCVFIYKNTQYYSFVLALYAICPYCIDVVQLRNTFAAIFLLIGLDALMNFSRLRAQIIYICSVCLATMVHSSSFVFLLVLVSKVKKKTIIFTTLIVGIVIALLTNPTLIENFGGFVASEERIEVTLERLSSLYTNPFLSSVYVVLLMLGTFFIINVLLTISKKQVQLCKDQVLLSASYLEKIRFALRTNIFILSIIPSIFLILDMYRIQRYLLLFMYIAISYFFINSHTYMCKRKSFMSDRDFLCISFVGVIFLFFGQIYLLNMESVDTIFTCLFTDNMIIR